MWWASLPLWLWALHFAASYVGVAVGCRVGWHQGAGLAGMSPLRAGLALVSALAIAAAALLLAAARRQPADNRHGLLTQARRIAAILALLAIVWPRCPGCCCRFAGSPERTAP